MPIKDIVFSGEARGKMRSGLDTLANAVKVTLGPRGCNVLLERPYGAPTITKDGVTVANELELANRFANLGAQMVKEVAAKTSEVTGDGTTTATVLAQAIFAEGAKLVTAGVDPMEIKRGIDAAVAAVVVDLERQSKATRGTAEIAQVGTISANGDRTIGNLIAEAMQKVGRDGVITVEEAKSIETTLEVVEGMQLDRGYISPYFVTDAERMEAILHDAYILVHEGRLSKMHDLVPILELVAGAGRALLVVAEDVDHEALTTLVVNRLRGTLKVCAIRAPGFGEHRRAVLEDIAVLCGARAITLELGRELASLTLEDLGGVKSITVNKDTTTLVEGAGAKADIAARVQQIRGQLEHVTSDFDRDKLQERLAKLAGGIAVIAVGAASETEMKEKKARVEDALHATRAAVEEGIVPGGGVALLRTLGALAKVSAPGEARYGVAVVRRALEEPLRQLARNGGAEAAVVVGRVIAGKGAFGYNVASREYEDLIEAGVIDPTKVVRVALQNAASIASLMLTTEAMIVRRAESAASTGR